MAWNDGFANFLFHITTRRFWWPLWLMIFLCLILNIITLPFGPIPILGTVVFLVWSISIMIFAKWDYNPYLPREFQRNLVPLPPAELKIAIEKYKKEGPKIINPAKVPNNKVPSNKAQIKKNAGTNPEKKCAGKKRRKKKISSTPELISF